MAIDSLPSGWEYRTIGELEQLGLIDQIQDGNHGEKHPRSNDYVATGIPFIMARDLENNELDLSGCAFLSKQHADTLRIGFARPGDVLLTHKATMGRVAIVPPGFDYVMLTPQVTYYRVSRQNGLLNSFLKYAFLGPDFQHQLNSDSGQSTRKYIGITEQRRLSIPLPPPTEQRCISEFLSNFDERLDTLRKSNRTLEAIARAIFKSWFVDFDPVRAKAEGREPEGMDAATAALFPSEFTESELGLIPDGWQIRTIGELAEVIGGSTPSTKEPQYWVGGENSWATPKDLSALKTPILLSTEKRITQKGLECISSGLLSAGTLLLSSRAPIGYLAIAEIPVAINQGFIAMKPNKGISNLFLLFWTRASHEAILSRANGSTFLEISKSAFRPMPVIVPSFEIMASFDALVRPLYETMVNNEEQTRVLVEIRDTLLPRLISGKLRVPEAESMLSEVL